MSLSCFIFEINLYTACNTMSYALWRNSVKLRASSCASSHNLDKFIASSIALVITRKERKTQSAQLGIYQPHLQNRQDMIIRPKILNTNLDFFLSILDESVLFDSITSKFAYLKMIIITLQMFKACFWSVNEYKNPLI